MTKEKMPDLLSELRYVDTWRKTSRGYVAIIKRELEGNVLRVCVNINVSNKTVRCSMSHGVVSAKLETPLEYTTEAGLAYVVGDVLKRLEASHILAASVLKTHRNTRRDKVET